MPTAFRDIRDDQVKSPDSSRLPTASKRRKARASRGAALFTSHLYRCAKPRANRLFHNGQSAVTRPLAAATRLIAGETQMLVCWNRERGRSSLAVAPLKRPG